MKRGQARGGIEGTLDELGLAWLREPGMMFEDQPLDVTFLVLAVEGQADDWAAYVGRSHHGAAFVRANGLKLRREDAVRLFPVFSPAA